jgi:hypothetical protein
LLLLLVENCTCGFQLAAVGPIAFFGITASKRSFFIIILGGKPRHKLDKRISKVVEAPGFIRGINPKSKIENPQAPAFIRGVNLKSQISNLKSIDGFSIVK